MSSPTLENLRHTLRNIRRRRSRLYVLQQVSLAVIAVTVLALSLSLLEAWLQPSRAVNITLFFVLLAGVAAAIGFVVVRMQRMQQDDQFLAQYVDGRIPDLEQRLLTSLEFTSDDIETGRTGVSQQFIRQLWADAEAHVHEQQTRVDQVVSSKTSWYSASSALAVVVVAMSALLLSDALLNAAGKLFWPFTAEPVVPVAVIEEPLEILISVEPGDISMQRGEAATIVARVTNASPSDIQLRIQTDNVNWQDLTMQQDGSGSNSASYSYFMPSVQEDLVYYVNFVQNGEQRSEQFRISLYDLPRVEQIDLAYQYPQYTGIENNAEEDTGDMLVPEGTQVELQVTFNKNVESAVIEFQEGEAGYESVPLTIDGSTGRASFTVAGDGVYRVVATDFDDLVSKDPLDYYIRSIPDQPPELVLKSPGQDQDVMPLEEVVLEVEANDDYGLSEFNLHYAVVGADEVAVDFLPPEQTRSIAGNELIYLEDLAVAPGDFVSYYLTLADNNGLTGPAAVVSDIYFLQVIPTDQEFRRAGGGGGGGGGGGQGGGESSALVTLQKDIIAATWKLRNQQLNADPATFATDVQIISESQRDATARARQSIDRLAERLNFSDDSYDSAVLNLQQAIEQMTLAIAELDKQQITSALKPEQVALQFILKAEADINRTDVSTEQQAGGGGGGGGSQQEREDLRELFEMEMGQLENRYETPQSAGGGGGGQQTEEANKLEELARRQEGLTRAQRDLARRMEAMNEEQRRRELERLQREQEQLSQEVAQLAQQLSRGQQQGQQQQNQQQQGQQGQQSQSQQGPQPGSAQGSSQGQSQQASAGGGSATGGQNQNQSQLERAAQQMQDAAQADSPAQAAARSQRALESLREQQRQMAAEQNTSVNQLAQNAAQRGEQLLQQQRELQQDLQTANREQGLGTTRQDARSSEELQELIAAQQAQRNEIEEIEKMLRAIIARGENEDQQLLSQAQQASRAIRPIREEMDTSSRVLSNGMVNLAVDIEQEIGNSLDEMNAALQAMNSANTPASSDPIQQAARNAAELMQQMQELERQALALNQGDQSDASIAQMRQQLERSQQLAQDLATQLQQQQMEERTAAQRGANAQSQPGQQLAQGQQGQGQQAQGQQGQGGQGQQGGQQGQTGQGGSGANQQGQQPGNQQAGNQPGSSQTPGQNGGFGGDGRPAPTGGSNALGNARSIRSELTRQGIEDFLSQPELFTALLQPIMELEAELRAQAEMDRINQKLYASADEDVPDQYRRLVEEYYRVLSETNGADAAAP